MVFSEQLRRKNVITTTLFIPYDLRMNSQFKITGKFMNLKKRTILASVFLFTLFMDATNIARDVTIYPVKAPAEPNAIPLGTGGVKDQPAPETWFRQWGDPMARNISKATLTPFLPEPDRANGAAVIVAPGG